MAAQSDDLDKLLAEVRSTIRDNEQFLKSLRNDSDVGINAAEDAEVDEDTPGDGEFEEL